MECVIRVAVVFTLLSLVHCQQTYPHVSFMGQNLTNHSYVDLSLVGSASGSVQCHTDLSTCCSGAQGPHRGDWYFPNGSRLHFSADIYEGRGAQRVDLQRTGGTGPTGIYRCDIPTNAVHDVTDSSVRATVHIGLYRVSQGISIRKCSTISYCSVFQVMSEYLLLG